MQLGCNAFGLKGEGSYRCKKFQKFNSLDPYISCANQILCAPSNKLRGVPSRATVVTWRALCNSWWPRARRKEGSVLRTSSMRSRTFDMGISCPRPLEASYPTTCVRTRYWKSVRTWYLYISRTCINKRHSIKFQKGVFIYCEWSRSKLLHLAH